MLFGSLEFLFGFLPVTLLIYHWLRLAGRQRTAKLFLVAASVFFYGWWNPLYVPLVLLSVGGNFALSVVMEKRVKQARAILILGLVLNLALLGYYKYANFFVSNFDHLTGLELTVRKVLLPLGISFFTFQQITYLIEAYKDRKSADSLTDYALFVLFFPHLIAGPITHHKEMLPQFKVAGRGPLPYSYLAVGAAVLIMGLAKKAVVADTLATLANPVFHAADHGQAVPFTVAWMGALAYTFQLYFDFSGYSDMAIGLGLLFGIRMPVNFASPYKSKNITEFWRRWHITLSRFLRNYLYIPLGGNRKGPIRRYANLIVTMALGGLWHGAGWTFLAWGLLHGTYLMIHHMWQRLFPERPSKVRAGFGWAVTFLAVVVGWVLFKASTFEGAMAVLHGMASPIGVQPAAPDLAAPLTGWVAIAAAATVSLLLPNVLEMVRYPESTPGLPVEADGLEPVKWRLPPHVVALGLGVIAAFVLVKLPDPGVFLYFNF